MLAPPPYHPAMMSADSSPDGRATACVWSLTRALTLALVFLAGCATTGAQQTMAEYLDDAVITKRVQTRLAAHPQIGPSTISVETIGRVVHLRGTARSTAERTAAEAVAGSTPGVDAVRSRLAVAP